MKAPVGLLLAVMLAVSALNYWQIQSLREEVRQLEVKVNQRDTGAAAAVTDAAAGKALAALAQAREALAHMDTNRARTAYANARRYLAYLGQLEEAGRTASDKAGPAIRSLRDQAADLGRQLKDRLGVR